MENISHIVALGGGGFSEEPDNPLLDRYVLDLSSNKNPAICFLPTASGDSENYLLRFYKVFSRYECKTSHLSLFSPHTSDLKGFLLSQDIIYVGGGNTKSMLSVWKEWGLDVILKEAYTKGAILAGVSAGAICWFEQGATDSIPGKISALPCLGFLKGSCCPHFNSSELRRQSVPALIKAQTMKPGYAVDDCAALHFINGQFTRAVSSVKGRAAHYLEGDKISSIDTEYLG